MSGRRRQRYIANFELDSWPHQQPPAEPHSVADGLAVYTVGDGPPLLLLPYPHAHTRTPMIQGELAEALFSLGRTLISFDPPGAYRSRRPPRADMAEMLGCAGETLARLGISGPVDVAGHSMGGLCALAMAIESPQLVERLLLVGSFSGFPAVMRWGMPGSCFSPASADYWRLIFWGLRMAAGWSNMALHKRLQNLMGRVSLVDRQAYQPVRILPGDARLPIPIRMKWNQGMRQRLSYHRRLHEVSAPTLILAGRHDPQSPPPCAHELEAGIPGARLIFFQRSGHSPFAEEPALFRQAAAAFFNDGS